MAYADLVKQNKPIDSEHLAEHQAAVATRVRDAQNALMLLEHEKERRAAQKRVAKSLNVIVYAPALLEAMEDYIFELKYLAAASTN